MNPQENNDSSSSHSGGFLKSIFTAVIYVFAFLAAIVIKPAQALTREAYEKSSFNGFANFAGVILSIAGSIGAGYLAWQAGFPLHWWLPAALVAAPAVYYYAWPIAFLAVGRWAFKFSSFLWRNVAEPGFRRSANSSWFSNLLTALTVVTSVVAGIYFFFHWTHGVHDYLAWDNIFAWIGGIVTGGLAAVVATIVLISAVLQGGMPAVAVISGAALTYFFGVDVGQYLPAIPWVSAPVVRHTGEALQFAAYVGYLFPLAHLVVSRMFGWVGKYFGRLLSATYDDKDANYKGFLVQLVNIAVAATAGYYAFGYGATLGFGLLSAVPVTAVAVLAAYLFCGAILRGWNNVVVGVGVSALAAYLGYQHAPALAATGLLANVLTAAAAAFATAFLLFPLAYQAVKAMANPLLASWLGQPLRDLYKTIATEVFSSVEKTYEDDTAYGPLFVQVVNIAAAGAVYFLTSEFVRSVEPSFWLAVSLPVVLPVASYLFVGRLLVAYKTVLIGALASLGVGAFVGVEVFAHYQHNFWYAIPAFAAAGLVFGFAAFPVSYVVVRAGLELVAASRWAAPALNGVYNFFFGFVQKAWNEFVVVYKRIAVSFAPIWANVSRTWDEAWASAKETFEKAFNGKNK